MAKISKNAENGYNCYYGKTVKNTGGVTALQKMPKNYENIRQMVTGCNQLKGRGQIVSPLQKTYTYVLDFVTDYPFCDNLLHDYSV